MIVKQSRSHCEEEDQERETRFLLTSVEIKDEEEGENEEKKNAITVSLTWTTTSPFCGLKSLNRLECWRRDVTCFSVRSVFFQTMKSLSGLLLARTPFARTSSLKWIESLFLFVYLGKNSWLWLLSRTPLSLTSLDCASHTYDSSEIEFHVNRFCCITQFELNRRNSMQFFCEKCANLLVNLTRANWRKQNHFRHSNAIAKFLRLFGENWWTKVTNISFNIWKYNHINTID